MAFTQSEQELLLQSGFRGIGNFFDWGETIGGVRYMAKASGMLYQLVPSGTASWAVLSRASSGGTCKVTCTYSNRSGLGGRSEVYREGYFPIPPVQFMDAVYAQYPCKVQLWECFAAQSQYSLQPELAQTTFFGNNIDPALSQYDEVKAAFEKRHPIDAQQVEDQEKTRIFLEWKAMKDNAFFDALFEPVKELRAQGKKDAADKLQRSIQADLDKGILTPQTPKTRPDIAIPMRPMQKPVMAPVVVIPEGPKRLRRIIFEDD